MQGLNPVVARWIECWNTANLDDLPISDNFKHTSPFGTIEPKSRYLEIVEKNRNDFLGNKLTVLKHIQQGENVCIQFEQSNANTGLQMVVCEWYILDGERITEIQSFYNIGNAEITG